MKPMAILTLMSLLMASCATSSHVMIGTARPATSPDNVRLFVKPPAKYDEIALVDAEGKPSWAFTSQQQMDVAIGRLKAEAARLGANGILLGGIDDRYNGSIGSGAVSARGYSAVGISGSMPLYIKEAKGVAIHVEQE